MESEVDKMATTFLDQIGLQSSKGTATSEDHLLLSSPSSLFSQRTLSGLSRPTVQILSRAYAQICRSTADRTVPEISTRTRRWNVRVHNPRLIFSCSIQLVRDVVKFEMLIAAGAMEGLIYYLFNFHPSAVPGRMT